MNLLVVTNCGNYIRDLIMKSLCVYVVHGKNKLQRNFKRDICQLIKCLGYCLKLMCQTCVDSLHMMFI